VSLDPVVEKTRSNNAGQTKDRPTSNVERLLEAGLFAPLGFVLKRREVVPELAKAGRQQISFCQSLGKAALSTLIKQSGGPTARGAAPAKTTKAGKATGASEPSKPGNKATASKAARPSPAEAAKSTSTKAKASETTKPSTAEASKAGASKTMASKSTKPAKSTSTKSMASRSTKPSKAGASKTMASKSTKPSKAGASKTMASKSTKPSKAGASKTMASKAKASKDGASKTATSKTTERTASRKAKSKNTAVIPNYESLTAREIIGLARDCSEAQAAWIRAQESAGKQRVTIIRALDARDG